MLIFIFIFALSLACKEIPKVINGIFHLSTKQIEIGTEATLECFNGFDNQPQDVRSLSCGEDGTWKTKESKDLPSCLERTCPHVKQLIYGSSEIDGLHAANGGYSDGTVIMYSCAPGYILIGPQKRLCRNGNWSGEDPECLQRLCSVPPEVSHSVVKIQAAINMSPLSSHFPPGSVGTYYCYPGYEAAGTSSVKCDADGLWKPDSAVQCVPREGTPCQDCCNISNIWPHAKITVIQGTFTPRGALPGTLIEVTCVDGYKNMRELSCNSTGLRMHCKMSLWIGISPQCSAVTSCGSPPSIINGLGNIIQMDQRQIGDFLNEYQGSEGILANKPESYSIGTNIVYSCRPGYWLHGPSLLVCRSNGCWDPIEPPVCVSGSFLGFSDFDSVDVSSGMTLLVAVGTASCVICILAIVWLLISCIPRNERYRRRELRNPLSSIRRRAAPSPPQENREGTFIPSQRPDIPFPWDLLCPRRISNPASPIPPSSEGSQVSVDPDRLALIAFAEGVQVTLPSYEDAVRERAPPPYDAVVGTFRGVIRSSVAPMALRTVRTGRRSRTGGNLQNRATERIDNSDSVSQHSAFSGPFFPNRCGGGSLRTASYAGSIGSLDTVAASEGSGSTVVTHASDATSYSASSANSQTASTRGVCGSLASFDTLSMQNNEGVPLLEETEFDVPLESEGVENESQVMEP